MTGTKATGRFAWGGLGFYNFSFDCGGFGGCSTTDFGFNAGASVNVLPITPDLPLTVWGNVALAFGSGTFLPLTAGAGVRYDKLPVQLFGGLGLEIVPHTGGGSTPIGVEFLVMGLYPLPQVDPRLSVEAQLSYSILNQGFSLFVFTAGVGYSF